MGDRIGRTELWSLLGIVVLAVVLRCIQLGAGLWYDEVITLTEYVRLPWADLVTTYSSTNNHILYSLAAKGAVTTFGESAWALRLPAMVFGVGSIAALWWLGRLVVTRTEALLGSLLLACAYHHVWFSQNARGYTGLLCAALVATALFVKGMRDPTNRRVWIAYAVVFGLAMYLHLSAAFLFATHGLAYLWVCIRNRDESPGWHPWWGFGLGALITLICYGPLLPQMFSTFGDMSQKAPPGKGVSEWKSPIWTVLETLRSMTQGNPMLMVGAAGGLALGLVGWLSLWKSHPVFALVPAIHVPLTLGILIVGSFRIWPRYFFIDAGFILLCVVHGIFVLSGWAAGRVLKGKVPGYGLAVSVTALALMACLYILPGAYRLPKQDFVGARDHVEATRGPDDVVVSVGLAATVCKTYFAPQWEVVETLPELQKLRSPKSHTWLVYSFPKHTESKYPEIVDEAKSNFELVRTFWGTLAQGQVLVYRSR